MGRSTHSLCISLLLLLTITAPAYGFGAGNIASIARIEGQNWRHGDIEDTLLTLFLARVAGGRQFSKLDVKRVYFGNWLRDYSQAVDVGTVKYVSAEAIRILIWVLGFMSFGYGTREFEVTTERLGCYQPTEHIDNPLGYAEGDDARRYDRRLRGPVDEERELSVDPRTGLKSYIASEDAGIATSAGLVRRVLGRSIQLGRRFARSRNDKDLHEALRLMGTGLHCLEDYAAHSNYTELSLIELGESRVFPHVGRNTQVQVCGVRGHVYPIVTGTFGGVDFFHSVLGELSDKTMQSEIQSLERVISESENAGPSENVLQDLLNNIPDGLIGGSDSQAGRMDDFKAQADDARRKSEHVSPRKPEQWTKYLEDVQRQIYPILEWHDELLKAINAAIEQIPVLPELIEQIRDQITIFVFSILAPFILPIIRQVKAELETGSSEVIQSSREQQHIVFNNDNASDPTHSMLSKDHFSNVLNEPAGRIASNVLKWAVPQLMQCWDDENANMDRTLDRIISAVFHHPALHDYGDDGAVDMRRIMFSTVEQWWSEKSEDERDILRGQLSRDGILKGKNHKEGVHDSGHGCGKPPALPQGHQKPGKTHQSGDTGVESFASEAVGGGALGGLVGGLVGGMGCMLLSEDKPALCHPDDPRPPRPHHRKEHGRQHRPQHETESYGELPPHGDGSGYQSQQSPYEGRPEPRNDYPPMAGYRREDYQYRPEYSGEGDHHWHERPKTHRAERDEYEERPAAYEYVERRHGHEEYELEISAGYDRPHHRHEEHEDIGHCRRERHDRRDEDDEGEHSERRHRHRRHSGGGSGSERGGSDGEHAHRRHHKHHRHHHHDHGSGEDSD